MTGGPGKRAMNFSGFSPFSHAGSGTVRVMRRILYSFPVRLMVVLFAIMAAAVILGTRGLLETVRAEVRACF